MFTPLLPFRTAVGGICLIVVLAQATGVEAQAASVPRPPDTVPPPRHKAEQMLINLPGAAPMRRFGSHVRIAHRFARNLRVGSLSELAEDLFGLDSGSILGLEYRFAPAPRAQVGVYRSSLFRTVQFSGRFDLRGETEWPAAVALLLSVEGTDNIRDQHAPAAAFVLSRALGGATMLYAAPTLVWDSRAPLGLTGHEGHEHEHAPETRPWPTPSIRIRTPGSWAWAAG